MQVKTIMTSAMYKVSDEDIILIKEMIKKNNTTQISNENKIM